MKQNEVVATLKYYISNIYDVDECKKDIKAFTEAIRCVELHDELVKELENFRIVIEQNVMYRDARHVKSRQLNQLIQYDEMPGKWHHIKNLLKKAKGEE